MVQEDAITASTELMHKGHVTFMLSIKDHIEVFFKDIVNEPSLCSPSFLFFFFASSFLYYFILSYSFFLFFPSLFSFSSFLLFPLSIPSVSSLTFFHSLPLFPLLLSPFPSLLFSPPFCLSSLTPHHHFFLLLYNFYIFIHLY